MAMKKLPGSSEKVGKEGKFPMKGGKQAPAGSKGKSGGFKDKAIANKR